MSNPFIDNLEFMRACGKVVPERPTFDVPTEAMQWGLVEEEYKETVLARERGDIVETADGIIDTIKVLLEYGESIGIDTEAVWNEIHRSNMAKVDPETGAVVRRDDGKILKPEGWKKPDVRKVLFGDAE
ncbi:pyrophosphohydrolase domain-containing protein [Achromobacter sp. AGC39]